MTMGSRLLLRLSALIFLLTGTTLTKHLGKAVATVTLGRCLAGLGLLDASAVFVRAPVSGHQEQASC